MSRTRLTRALVATALAAATVVATAQPADASTRRGTSSLATLLAADGGGFDRNPYDFDILDNAVTAVLSAKPASPVAVLADGRARLTAFLPTDDAFRRLVHDLTGQWIRSERAVFTAAATTLGVDTIEQVLLYHVVPGSRITFARALRSDGADLTTALGPSITVDVRYRFLVVLVDADPDDRNAVAVIPDLNAGNRQIAHGVTQVLRPANL